MARKTAAPKTTKPAKPISQTPPPAKRDQRKTPPAHTATNDVKDMILEALNGVGGASYLERQAEENPRLFLSLIGKVLALKAKAAGPEGPIRVELVRFTDP